LKRIEADEVTAPPVGAQSPLTDIALGWRACSEHPIVFPLLLAQGTFGLFGGFFSAIYMIFTLRTLGLDAATVGIIIGVGGIGALWGAFVATPLSRRLGIGRAVVLFLACWVAASILIPAAEGRGALVVPFLVGQQLIGDGFLSAFMILAVSIRQTALHEDVQARAGATFQVVEGLSLPVGALIAGPLADVVGVGNVLWIAIAGTGVPLLILAMSRLWTLKTLEESRISA
jgi:predicted MFS family arabinose efflux permease